MAASSGTSIPVDPWTGMQQQQHHPETTDCGMMPPPNSTMAMSLRRSSSGTVVNGTLVDQLSPTSSCSSNCSLKVEVNDESSQVILSTFSHY